MGKIICLANQKGGVGKTTTTVNLSACLAAVEKKTLLVDMDPQGNATSGVGLHCLTSNSDLIGVEVELVGESDRSFRLKNLLDPVAHLYDYLLIDCPPSLGLLTLNALTAAHSVLIPVQTEYYALEGLSSLMETVERVRESLNPRLHLEGAVLTMYDGRTKLAMQVADEVRSFFGEKVYQTVIPRNVQLSEAPSHGKPVILYDIRSSGAQAYLNLAKEIITRG
jgi:chromosome partitioning protein